MAIFENLSAMKSTEENKCFEFNGFLEDYLNVNEGDPNKELLESLLEVDDSLKIIVGFEMDIKSDVITNRIIRYKDAFKNAEKALHYDYVVYGKNQNGEERGVIITGNSINNYIFGKGLYYCMSEPESIFDAARNELVSCSLEETKETVEAIFKNNVKTGAVQRKLDQKRFANYDELYTIALAYANELRDTAKSVLDGKTNEEKMIEIKKMIVQWFIIKKVVYVQYMMNKSLLSAKHNNNIKEQRSVAKQNADSIPYYCFKDLWKL